MAAMFWWAVCCLALIRAVAPAPMEPRAPPCPETTRAALDAMMALYNYTTGLWDPNNPGSSWWQSGVALYTLVNYMILTGERDYLPQALNTVEIQRQPLPWWPDGGGEFRADSSDDTGWWALALVSLYELTGDSQYLEIAKLDEEYMYWYWNTTTCRGGLIWDIRTRTYHNAISNELYLELTAKLHNLIPGDSVYLERSLQEWDWFSRSGMINGENLINDGLTRDDACVNNGDSIWTYNQGVILGGLVELWRATGDVSYLETAQRTANAVLASESLVRNGTLTEDPCRTIEECEPNGTAFKGIFVRELAKLNRVLAGRPYSAFIEQNGATAYAYARNGSDFYGFFWQGPFDAVTIGTQAAAVDLLVAAL
ncbi:glycoside hydrolase family 76 protein [Durotheca rogersii]|uniref:glycoside hydrolase family 76 protein n=1 Tax=Durotheca rogersii TaxID=419775 RepID=UPI00221E522B|nr:glycoside hydrolase family 76 protein [Durotheca rogersii]KAI5859844.1 glycoside hydrolase family 76 protein [Durotheca rogersii]